MANLSLDEHILIKARLRHVQRKVSSVVKQSEHSGPVQGTYSYNHDSGSVTCEPVSYINIFCEELVEAMWSAYQESSKNLSRMLEEM